MSSTYWPIPPTPPCCMPRFCTSRSIHEDFWTQQYYHPDERVDIHRRRERQDMVVDYAMAVHEAKIYRRLRGTSLTEGRSSPVASIRHRTDNLAACRIQARTDCGRLDLHCLTHAACPCCNCCMFMPFSTWGFDSVVLYISSHWDSLDAIPCRICHCFTANTSDACQPLGMFCTFGDVLRLLSVKPQCT